MRSFILAASVLLNGCGSDIFLDHIKSNEKVCHRAPHVEPEFADHVQKFRDVYQTEVSILVEWDDLDEKTMGICYSWDDGYREIKIDRAKWPNLTVDSQEELIFHELGHCKFNLDHREETMDSGKWKKIPKSIMYPYVFGDAYYYDEFRQHYYDELSQ